MSKYHLIGHCEIVLTLMGWLLEDDVNFDLILISEIGNVWPGANSSNLFGRFWRRNWWRKWRWKEENCKNFLRQYCSSYILKYYLFYMLLKRQIQMNEKSSLKFLLMLIGFLFFMHELCRNNFTSGFLFESIKAGRFSRETFPLVWR